MATHSTDHITLDTTHQSDYIHAAKGWASWLTTIDHKRIGIMYLVLITVFFFFGATMGLLMRKLRGRVDGSRVAQRLEKSLATDSGHASVS